MQYETAKKMGDDKVGFLSPGAIAQTMFEWPLKLKYDAPSWRSERRTKKKISSIGSSLKRPGQMSRSTSTTH